ncbi:MAG: hypothetical protein P9M00_03190 [Candidatus Tritonobacter lacicola]|nr:hypothetical protein [Candidatus Tritonobacter lacicola]
MDGWLKAGEDMLDLVLGNPGTGLEKWVILALSFVVCVVVLKLVGGAMGGDNAFFGPSLACSFLGLALILACMTVMKLFVPRDVYTDHRIWILPVAGLAVSLIVIIPLIMGIMKTGYVGALVSWIVSAIVVAGVILIAGAAFDAMKAGGRDAGKIQRHREALEEVLQ